MAIQTLTGTIVYIGPVATTTLDTTAELAALAYTAIGEAEDIGEYGDVVNKVEFTGLNDGRKRIFKGTIDGGTCDITVADDAADAGQKAVAAAAGSKSDYAFKIVYSDGDVDYFRAKVMSFRRKGGASDAIAKRTISLSINSPVYG